MTWLKFVKQSMRNGYMTHPEKKEHKLGQEEVKQPGKILIQAQN